jgi:hypothetical protein
MREKIGNSLSGRPYKTDGSDNRSKPIEVEVVGPLGSGANTATPFFKFTATGSESTEDGRSAVTAVDVTNNTKSGGILVDVNGVNYWLPLYITA